MEVYGPMMGEEEPRGDASGNVLIGQSLRNLGCQGYSTRTKVFERNISVTDVTPSVLDRPRRFETRLRRSCPFSDLA